MKIFVARNSIIAMHRGKNTFFISFLHCLNHIQLYHLGSLQHVRIEKGHSIRRSASFVAALNDTLATEHRQNRWHHSKSERGIQSMKTKC